MLKHLPPPYCISKHPFNIIFLGIILYFFFLDCGFSQDFIHYTHDNGLPSNKVYMVTLDNDGFIWCATDKGLAMFNGEKFRIYTTRDGLPVNDLWKLYAAKDGKVWFFGRTDRLGYIENGKVHCFPSEDGSVMNPTHFGFSEGGVDIISEVSYRLMNRVWKKAHLSTEGQNLLRAKTFDSGGLFLFEYIHNNLILTIGGNKMVHLDTNLNMLREMHIAGTPIVSHKYITSGLSLGDSMFYFHIWDRLCIYNIKENWLHTIDLTTCFGKEDIKNMYMFYEKEGVFMNGPSGKYQLKGTSLVQQIAPIKMDDFEVRGFFRDSIGNTWVSTFNHGIFMHPAYNYRKNLFMGENVQKIFLHKNHLYAGVENKGLYKILDSKTDLIKTSGKYFYEISGSNDADIRVGTEAEFGIIEQDHIRLVGLTGNYYSIDYEEIRNIFIKSVKSYARFGEVEYFSNASIFFIRSPFVQRCYYSSGIYHIMEFENRIVLGTTSGLKILNKNGIEKINVFNAIQINKLFKFKDFLLIATEGEGVFAYKNQLIHIPGTEGMVVNSITNGNDSTVWIATDLGVHEVICQNDSFQLGRSVLRSNGLISNLVNEVIMVNDTLYCATENGLCMVELKNLKLNNGPNIMLSRIFINDSLYATNDTIVAKNTNRNTFDLEFDVAYLNEHSQLKYYYKVDPINKKWVELTSNSFAINGLVPGSYSVRIKVEGFNGNMNEKSFVLIIKPRWYERIEFILVIVFLGLGVLAWLTWKIITLIIKRRNQKYILENKLVNMELHALRSKLNPHFIFNTFGSIQLYINNNQLELSEKYLILLSKHIRNVFEYSHLQNISLEKEISLLNDYLEIEKTRFGDKIHIDIKVDPHLNIKSRLIPAMLIQPFVENSMVHGLFHKEGVGNLLIAFTYVDASSYEVKIADDGIGFVEKSSQRLSSTKVTNERVNLINQAKDFNVKIEKSYLDETKVEKGTVITIHIKNLQDESNIGG
jgi:hypothetical protein